MAIPFHLPSDEETEDNYRRLDQLLLDLYHVLRQILLRPSCDPGARTEEEPGQERPAPSGSRQVAGDVTGSRRLRPDLPDVVTSAVAPSCPCHHLRHASARRRHRRRRQSACCPAPAPRPREMPLCHVPPSLVPRPAEDWLVVGQQLRKIAEEFKTSFKKPEDSREPEKDLKVEVKTSGLFSLLVPAHFRSSLWTTVILLVGWRLLVRSR